MTQRLRMIGCMEVAIAASIWGSNGVIVNLVPLSSYVIAFFRVLFATIAISIGMLISGRQDLFRVGYPLKKLFVLGALLCLGWGLLFEAMKLLPIAEAVLLNYMAPIFVAILAVVFLKEKIKRRTIASLTLSFIGIVIIVFSNGSFKGLNLLGSIIGLSAGLAYAVFIILSKNALTNISNYTLVLYSSLFASIILAPSLVTTSISLPWNFWLMLLMLGIINTAFAVSLYFKGLNRIKAHEAAILAYLEPVSAAFFGFLFLKQIITPTVIFGGGLVILGGYIIASK